MTANKDFVLQNINDIPFSPEVKDALLNNKTVSNLKATIGDQTYYCSTHYLESVEYLVLGVMPEAEYLHEIKAVGTTSMVTFLVALLILAGVVIVMSRAICKALRNLDGAAKLLSEGELDVAVQVNRNDEIGDLSRHITKIVDRLKEYIVYIDEISSILGEISQGNLAYTLNQEYVGEFAKVKNALLEIQSSMSSTMDGITVAAQQVDLGASQIAQGAQTQAQGAVEQASSVEILSDRIQNLYKNANANVENAVLVEDNTKSLGEEIQKSNAEMSNLLVAIDDIAGKSNEIVKIIKAIEDIAFQTNILALNAAVEAARAGAAGKGFAVVADEVRNLAAKSSEAAKDTTKLIQEAVESVNVGHKIAIGTADILKDTTENTQSIMGKVTQIAESYQDLAHELDEIDKSVNEISSVIQNNSATAEQSAAASEELSGQADSMKDMMRRFRIK